jgi:hypothetical protein
MYSILFHISGIAILEICFFFYYIGPMETFIFENKVKQLSNEPIDIISTLNTRDDDRYSTYNQTEIVFNELRSERNDAADEREEKNHQLFIDTILYWGIITFTSLILIIVINYGVSITKSYVRLRSSSQIDEETIELVVASGNRTRSESEPHLETKYDVKPDKNRKICYNTMHYVFFGGCVVCFQYMFFQFIVLVYDPLSIEEVKYITYNQIYPELTQDV